MNRPEDGSIPPEIIRNRKMQVEREYLAKTRTDLHDGADDRTAVLRRGDCEWLAWAIVRIADYGLSPRPVEMTSPGTTEMAIRDLNALRSLAITLNALSRAPGDGGGDHT